MNSAANVTTTRPSARSSSWCACSHVSARMTAGMALENTVRPARQLGAEWQAALGVAWRATLVSRVLVIGAGALAVVIWGVAAQAGDFDPRAVTHGFGSWGDPLASTFARWDSTWYLAIADD